MMQQDLIPHLFRTEFGKITAVLCKYLGIAHITAAEDIAGDTFLLALETWPYKGKPANPVAWLYTVAKNKARNHVQRDKLFTEKVVRQLPGDPALLHDTDIDLSDKNIADSQLQMLFAICHTSLAAEAQIGLALRILCGFGIDEIASALLTNKDTINKRLLRAKEKLRAEQLTIALPPATAIKKRLNNVLRTLYLLYNEGYYSESNENTLRESLCMEAMRLTQQLIDNELTNCPEANALLALMCFQSSRFDARKSTTGIMILYNDQDARLWNQQLISEGAYYLQQAATGDTLSKYHLEATIAYWHTFKEDTTEKWTNILQLFDHLLLVEYSSVAALNRLYALAKVKGNEAAIQAAAALDLSENHYYQVLLGELFTGIDNTMARTHFTTALQLAKTAHDKIVITAKLAAIAV